MFQKLVLSSRLSVASASGVTKQRIKVRQLCTAAETAKDEATDAKEPVEVLKEPAPKKKYDMPPLTVVLDIDEVLICSRYRAHHGAPYAGDTHLNDLFGMIDKSLEEPKLQGLAIDILKSKANTVNELREVLQDNDKCKEIQKEWTEEVGVVGDKKDFVYFLPQMVTDIGFFDGRKEIDAVPDIEMIVDKFRHHRRYCARPHLAHFLQELNNMENVQIGVFCGALQPYVDEVLETLGDELFHHKLRRYNQDLTRPEWEKDLKTYEGVADLSRTIMIDDSSSGERDTKAVNVLPYWGLQYQEETDAELLYLLDVLKEVQHTPNAADKVLELNQKLDAKRRESPWYYKNRILGEHAKHWFY